ncbi:MAG: sigma 54-interacting transcriptional regulator [Deltaproteobacteria bacterium]|nr:sigma 54-interacting transcriptional regulator [Deltaproteobacteria bacterium]
MTDPAATLTESSTARRQRLGGTPSGRLCLVVIGEGLDATHPLPDGGKVSIGRAPECDIRIDHPSVSRSHALLTIGNQLVIADSGSANGTRIRDRWLQAGASAEVALGEPIDVGSVMVVVQQRSQPAQQRHIWAHGYFEARLEEECARAQASSSIFAVIRIHCRKRDASRTVEQTLGEQLRPMDVIGYYGPSEHEVLLVDITREEVASIVTKLGEALEAAGAPSSIGLAMFPTDARNPYELLARASASAMGQRPQAKDHTSLVIANAAIQNLDRIVHRIAGGTISVLVTGETGVGKEVLAERIHRLSRRADKPFLRLNCAALSESLLESELFGHEKGAFTGAVQTKAGLLETADGGTVFLDEIGELPMTIQVKLLRVLEERQVLRVGALKPRFIDVRFVAATNRDLEVEIQKGTFRQDLYFRLNGITLVIPPLRERTSEIPDLAVAFVKQASERNGVVTPPGITRDALTMLCEYTWPGNIRELRNVIERAVLLAGSGGTIDVDHLPIEKMRAATRAIVTPKPPTIPPPLPSAPQPDPLAVTLRPNAPPPASPAKPDNASERDRIVDALVRAGGNQKKAAELLGVSRRTLINRLAEYGIPRPRKK